MYTCSVDQGLSKFAKLYPVICITDPRQSRKITLAKMLFNNLLYVSLENLDIREQAWLDPRAFLKQYSFLVLFLR